MLDAINHHLKGLLSMFCFQQLPCKTILIGVVPSHMGDTSVFVEYVVDSLK